MHCAAPDAGCSCSEQFAWLAAAKTLPPMAGRRTLPESNETRGRVALTRTADPFVGTLFQEIRL